MVREAKVEIIDGDAPPVREFNGWLGGFWSVLFYAVESRRKVKKLEALAKVIKAEQAYEKAEYERTKDIALTKANEIRKNCTSGMHEAESWTRQDGKIWQTTLFNKIQNEFYVVVGRCKHCGDPLSKRHYTIPE